MLDPYDPNCMIHEEYQQQQQQQQDQQQQQQQADQDGLTDYRRNLSPPATLYHQNERRNGESSSSRGGYHNNNRHSSHHQVGRSGGGHHYRNERSRSRSIGTDRYSSNGHYNNSNGGSSRYRRSSPSSSSRRYDDTSSSSSRYRSYKDNGGGGQYRRSSRSRSPVVVHRAAPLAPLDASALLSGLLQQQQQQLQLQQQQQHQQPPVPEINFKWDRTVFVSNLPLDIRWFDIKDLFRRKVGDIVFSEVFEKDQRALGFGAVTFRTTRDAERAVEVMHNYDLAGRKMNVKLDRDGSRTRAALEEAYTAATPSSTTTRGIINPLLPTTTTSGLESISSLAQQILAANSLLVNPLIAAAAAAASNQVQHTQQTPPVAAAIPPLLPPSINGSTVSLQLLNQIAAQAKVDGPVSTRLHVSGLSYRVEETRLRELFSTAGNLLSVVILRDRDNNSRGMANIEFETPLEALTALLTLNKTVVEDRAMNIIFDTRHASRSNTTDSKNDMNGGRVSSSSITNGAGAGLRSTNGNKYNGSVPSIIGIQPNSTSLLNSLLVPPTLPTTTNGAAMTSNTDLTGLAAALGLNPATLGLLGNLNLAALTTTPGGLTSTTTNNNNKPPNRVCKILVKNVPYSWDEFKVRDIFGKAGRIESVDARTGKGVAYIRYSSGEEARKAIDQLNGARFEGRTLEITFDYHH